MLLDFSKNLKRLAQGWHPAPPVPAPPVPAPAVPLERPNLWRLAQPGAALPQFVRDCPVAQKYLQLLGSLDWEHFPERDEHRPWPGDRPEARAPFVAAYLVKLNEQKRYMSHLRAYLVDHPALVWVLGFPLKPCAVYPWGFDADACLPNSKRMGRVLRDLPNSMAQFLLGGVIQNIRQALPAELAATFGDIVSIDTKHIVAWVKENNPKAYVKERYNSQKQPKGDRDCRLGCKRKRNIGAAAESTPDSVPTPTTDPKPASHIEAGEYYWGYASGTVVTKVPGWGEFLLAELTQPFNCGDLSYFEPLMKQTEQRLGRKPRFGAADAAFDAFYVYQYFRDAQGFAAVPYVAKGGHPPRQFDPAGLPLCRAGLPMPLKSTFIDSSHSVEHEKGRYVCPLLFPAPTGEVCPIADPHWPTGGCVSTMPTCQGIRDHHQLDRHSDSFKAIYHQRTADERINSQALELGIERPKLRHHSAIANMDTLIYVLINLRGLQRVVAQQARLAKLAGQAQ